MTNRCGPRNARRYRRPAPLTATRSQIRQKVGQLRDLYQVQAFLDDLNTTFLSETMASIEEQV